MNPLHEAVFSDSQSVTITLADGTLLPGCRPDLLNIGDLLARNWSIFPLKPRSKVPAIRWEECRRRFPTFDEIERWFTRPGFNVGIVTGQLSKIFVIDADSPEAVEWTQRNLPPCDLRVRTAKGLHLYIPYEGKRPIRNKARITVGGKTLELDVRGEGGYVVGPGSIHPNGHVYVREGSGWAWS